MRARLDFARVEQPERLLPRKGEEIGCKRVTPSHSYLEVGAGIPSKFRDWPCHFPRKELHVFA